MTGPRQLNEPTPRIKPLATSESKGLIVPNGRSEPNGLTELQIENESTPRTEPVKVERAG